MQCKVLIDKNDFAKCVMLGEHQYNEVEKQFSILPFNPKWELLLPFFEQGIVTCIGLFHGAKVVGYVMNIMTPSIMSAHVDAKEIAMYVAPEFRGQGWFKKMLALAEEDLIERGCTSYHIAFKKGHEHMLPEGYVESETFYRKNLEELWQ